MTTPEPLITKDLSFATFLSMQGYSYTVTPDPDLPAKALFVFTPVTDDEAFRLDELEATFMTGAARVEPVRFTKEIAAVRGKLYDFLRRGH